MQATEDKLTALVFKIQANMDPNHRDRIAFARVCSGRLERGMRLRQVRTGKSIPLHAPQFFFARDRQIAEEAFAGDVVGIPNHGTLRIGDTLTEDEDLNFVGVPYFAPEILRRVRLDDAMKAKKLRQALQELAEEGVVQLFRPQDGSQPIVGVVGTLQLDVLQARLAGEYGVAIGFEPVPYALARWVTGEKAPLARFIAENRTAMADDVDGDPVYPRQLRLHDAPDHRAARRPDLPRHQGRARRRARGLMDKTDRKLLALLQEDCTLSIAQLAEQVHLSQTPAWKRIQRLEANGVIERRVALLSPEKLGLGLTVFVSIEAGDHSPEWLDAVRRRGLELPGGGRGASDGGRHRLHAAGRRAGHPGL